MESPSNSRRLRHSLQTASFLQRCGNAFDKRHVTRRLSQPSPTPNPEEFGTVAVLGGTGPQGRGLARRFAAAGIPVVIGSRDAGRAGQAAEPMAGAGLPVTRRRTTPEQRPRVTSSSSRCPTKGTRTCSNRSPRELAGKIVVDCVNPLGFDKQGAFYLDVPAGSAAQEAAAVLPDSRVVAAFHHVSAVVLEDESVDQVETDVLVLGEDREATDLVGRLADIVPGMRGIFAGRLRNARSGRGAHRQPDLHQPALQGTRRPAGHRRLTRKPVSRCRRAAARRYE